MLDIVPSPEGVDKESEEEDNRNLDDTSTSTSSLLHLRKRNTFHK